MKTYFNLYSQWDENIELFSQETYELQILWNETLINAEYKVKNISVFH